MTNPTPTPSGPTLNPTGIWVSGFFIGLLVGLVPWAISQFLPRGDRSAEQQSLNVISPGTPQQEGFSIPQNQTPPVTATPVPTSSSPQTVTQAPSTIPSQPSTSQPSISQTSTNVNVSSRPIPARW
ncbi:MAG: hypothetical protein WBB29_19025 [Geitlerinemataceae cyanobacterium]